MSLRSTTIDHEARPRSRPAKRLPHVRPANTAADRTCFWAGRLGRLYRFTVHSLIECNAPPRGAYVLVKRGAKGPRALFAGVAASLAPTVNLARIRRRGAALGADEVHVIALTGSTADVRRVVRDIRAGSGLALKQR